MIESCAGLLAILGFFNETTFAVINRISEYLTNIIFIWVIFGYNEILYDSGFEKLKNVGVERSSLI